jgi:hypothetical protein
MVGVLAVADRLHEARRMLAAPPPVKGRYGR